MYYCDCVQIILYSCAWGEYVPVCQCGYVCICAHSDIMSFKLGVSEHTLNKCINAGE